MRLQELVLCATAPQAQENGAGSIILHDIQNATTLASFKQTSALNHCTAVFESKSNEGGFILSAQPDKSILNIYNFQKDQIALKIVLPEKLTCIAIDKNGDYCAGGTAQGRIYLWEIASGILFNSWDAHYRRVNVLRYTNDGTALVSGSDDSSVNVWLVARLVSNDEQAELPTPHITLSDHTLPITDIQCGVGTSLTTRILTSSMDHSVKIWDISSGQLLTTFQFPQVITHLAWDVTERLFFAAAPDGAIHRVNLYRKHQNGHGEQIIEAVGGGGTSDIIHIDPEEGSSQKQRLISVQERVTSIAISLTSAFLLVGTESGIIHLYDLPSHQLLRTITSHKGYSITYLATLLKPPDLVGHVSLDLKLNNMTDAKDALPAKPAQPFQKMKDARARDAHEITMMLHTKFNPLQDDTTEYSEAEFLSDHAFFAQPTFGKNEAVAPGIQSEAAKARISELESEVLQLKEQLGKAKGVNDAMWDAMVQRLAQTGETIQNEVGKEDDTNDPRQRKRSRGL